MTSRFVLFPILLLLGGVLPAGAQQAPSGGMIRVAYPGKTWAVEINAPDSKTEIDEMKSDGRRYFFATSPQTGLEVSITLERDPKGADSKTCPDYLRGLVQHNSSLGIQNVQYTNVGSLSVAEYLVPSFRDAPIQQQNMFACTAREDVYVDIHLSKVKFKPEDEALFDAALKSFAFVSVTPAPAIAGQETTEHDSQYYMGVGSRFYMQQNYKAAIGPYQKALDLEKQNPKLTKTLWLVLVDNLGMAYGITGDLDHAETTFNYGLSKDSTYPMFYYNLACTFAERNKMDRTMDFLKKAFSYKANVIPGEQMPDPHVDDSFQRFMKNAEFRQLVDSLTSTDK